MRKILDKKYLNVRVYESNKGEHKVQGQKPTDYNWETIYVLDERWKAEKIAIIIVELLARETNRQVTAYNDMGKELITCNR